MPCCGLTRTAYFHMKGAFAMHRELVEDIRNNTLVMFHNVRTMLRTFDPEQDLCGQKLWKHAYHLLHSCDQWYINPNRYEEPAFHVPGLNNLDAESDRELDREKLLEYLKSVEEKILRYLDGLTDEDLYACPEGSSVSRLSLILGQMRHLHCHLGNINACTILKTGEWPNVVGMDGIGRDLTDEPLYE